MKRALKCTKWVRPRCRVGAAQLAERTSMLAYLWGLEVCVEGRRESGNILGFDRKVFLLNKKIWMLTHLKSLQDPP